ncbi:hypothetical protein [Acidisoma silvae]|uniref:Nitrite/Sulfite reductase ferredoxin-like domain-containing protein n=1 Tax=Acidisoma silvae TaxID=2802396 RepID=A0A963YRN5_9PROT|nr:hypothetical protein [Acidisoma silvae]MCB8875692.1 hypothetical protein [Acidisoma silvae]
MTAPDMVRGWCPSLFRPMESGDGWLARVRPQAGCISADLALAVAEAAARFGNGIIEVTNRANIQIRGLQPATIAPFTDAIEAAGGAAGEGSRLLVSPLLGADPTMAADTVQIGNAVTHALHDMALAPKFGIVLDGGGALPLTGIGLDITIRYRESGWQMNGEACAPGDIAARIQALAGQTARVITRAGAAPKPGYHADSFALVAPAFGQMTAAAFGGLARLAQTHGDGHLRPTPWKSLCIAGVRSGDATGLLASAQSLGFITTADDGRLSIVTCAGQPACARGEVETHMAAAMLAQHRRASDSLIHLSGCAKGCAHPGKAPLTLIGRDGLFDLVHDGGTADMPAKCHLTLAQTLAQIAAVMHSLPS